MLSAIRDIGCLVSTKAISGNKRIEGKILAILFNDDNSAFQEISVEDFDVEKINRYLYREGATKGNTPAPIAQITKPDKTFNKKILAVKFEGGKNFLGDYDVFRKAVSHFANEKTSKSSAISNVCSVCGELK